MEQGSTIHFRTGLLTSVAAVTLALAAATAEAADRTLPGAQLPLASVWTYLDVGRNTYSGQQFFGGDPASGWTFTGGIGTPSRYGGWGFALRGTVASSDGWNSTFTGPVRFRPATGPVATRTVTGATRVQSENHGFLDFEIGRNVGIGIQSSPAQLSVGLRVARFDHKASLAGSATTTTTTTPAATPVVNPGVLAPFHATGGSRFVGAGPHISFDGSAPVFGPLLSVDYRFGAAVIYGRRHSTYSYAAAGRTATSSSNSNGWHGNLDASLALGWQIAPSAKLSVGYKVEYWQAILDSFDGVGNFHAENRIAHGPFGSLTLWF